jgi:hypothetical protein
MAVSGVIGLLNAVLADEGLGDVKLAVAVGAWMAHLGPMAWATGVLLGQLLISAVTSTQIRVVVPGGVRLDYLAAVLPDPLDGTVPRATTLMKLTTRCGTATG